MRKFIITVELRDLENQVHNEEISYSRMVEILCEKADEYAQNKFLEKISTLEEKNSSLFIEILVNKNKISNKLKPNIYDESMDDRKGQIHKTDAFGIFQKNYRAIFISSV